MVNNKGFAKFLIIILALSMIILPLISAVVSADDDNKIFFNFLEDTDDILESKIFYSKDITVTGRAIENTTIRINKYWFKPQPQPKCESSIILREKNYDSGRWVLSYDIEEIVGASEIFIIPVRINMGKYKIEVIAINDDDEVAKEIIVECYDKEQINREFRTRVFNNFDLNKE